MYCGEVSVAQEDLNKFLSVAEELKIKGLTQGQQKANESENQQQHSLKKDTNKPRKTFNPPNQSQFQSRPSSNQLQNQTVRKYQSPAPMAQNDDPDDIQEVVPVKSENIVDDGPSGGGGDMMMYNDEQYTEYDEQYQEEYDDQQQYDAAGLVTTEDGNKGKLRI